MTVFVAGCTGGGGAGDAAPPLDDASISCRNDAQTETYAAGMTHPGGAKTFDFVLVSSDPAPPARGNDTWLVRVEKNGQPQTGATVRVDLFMPRHGHGTSVVPVVTPMGDGYSISPLYLFMPGLWRVTITATVGSDTDSAAFYFCVEG